MLEDPSPPSDVRMRGFRHRTRVEAALGWIDAHTPRLPAEIISLREAHGRVLEGDLQARRDVPAFTRAAMDGYALQGAATVGAGDYNPLPFEIVGEALPGRPFAGTVPAAAAVRIMTGAPLPAGADAVLPAEFARESCGQVEALAPVSPGKHVGPRGEDVLSGTVVFQSGRRLRPQDVGLAASVGFAEIPVLRKPRVRLIITGNELVVPGDLGGDYQIIDSNSSMLCGLIDRDGGLVESVQLVQDDRQAIARCLAVSGVDVILVSGGSSVGAEDHAPTLVQELGTLAIHGVAMRPSSPSGMGQIGPSLVFLLPGNPVSCLCAYDFFAGRALRRLGGRSGDWPYVSRVVEVGRKIVSSVGRVDYTRVRFIEDKVEALASSGASILSSTTRADGFVIIPAELEGYPPGASVTVFLYDLPG